MLSPLVLGSWCLWLVSFVKSVFSVSSLSMDYFSLVPVMQVTSLTMLSY